MEKSAFVTDTLNNRGIISTVKSLFVKMGRSMTKQATIVEFISALLIILFIYTGINKIMDYEKFKTEMGRSPFIQNMSQYIAILLPSGELVIALLLIIKRTRLVGFYVSFFIMSLFTGYIWLMLNYAYDLPCSCGGIISQMSWRNHLYFNTAFTVLAATATILESKAISDKRTTPNR